jgi:hypothetical protein
MLVLLVLVLLRTVYRYTMLLVLYGSGGATGVESRGESGVGVAPGLQVLLLPVQVLISVL